MGAEIPDSSICLFIFHSVQGRSQGGVIQYSYASVLGYIYEVLILVCVFILVNRMGNVLILVFVLILIILIIYEYIKSTSEYFLYICWEN